MNRSIIDISRELFFEVVKPILEREFPDVTALTAFGLYGYGSEALGMDDELSRDHHWGVRIDGLVPDTIPHSGKRRRPSACSLPNVSIASTGKTPRAEELLRS